MDEQQDRSDEKHWGRNTKRRQKELLEAVEVEAAKQDIWGPFDHTAAIIINEGGGTVSILKGNGCIKSYPDDNSKKDVAMVFLEPGVYFWAMKGSSIKMIKKPSQNMSQ